MLVQKQVMSFKLVSTKQFIKELALLKNCLVKGLIVLGFCQMVIWLLVLEKENLEEFPFKLCNWHNKIKSWVVWRRFHSLGISRTFSVEPRNLTFTGSTLPLSLLNSETLVIMKESMMSLSHITSQMFSQLLQLMKSEFGMLKIDRNF